MNEKTLNQVGQEAARNYSTHTSAANYLATIDEAADAKEADALRAKMGDRPTNAQIERMNELSGRRFDRVVHNVHNDEVAPEFVNDNIEQLHDSAVIEAHMAGVAINVEQPIVVGQKVEVHSTDEK